MNTDKQASEKIKGPTFLADKLNRMEQDCLDALRLQLLAWPHSRADPFR